MTHCLLFATHISTEIVVLNIIAIYIHKKAWCLIHLSSNPVHPALPLSLDPLSSSVSLWIQPYPCRPISHSGDQCYNMLPLCACNPADPFTLICSLSWGDWHSLSWVLSTDLMAVQLHTQENGYSDSGERCMSVEIQYVCQSMYHSWLSASWCVILCIPQSETYHSCRCQADCHLSPPTSFGTLKGISGTTLPFPGPSSQTGRLSDPLLQNLVVWVPLLMPILQLSLLCLFVLASHPAQLVCPQQLRASLPGPWTWSPPAWPTQCK